MDYRYIEQLLERYWAAETTQEEERTLQTFFAQPDVPAHLARYKALFDYERAQASVGLDESFDERLCALAEKESAPANPRRTTLRYHLKPYFGAAASVALICFLGFSAYSLFEENKKPVGWDYNSATYTDTYENPETAYDESVEALKLIKDGLNTAVADSVGIHDSYTFTEDIEE